MTGCDAPAADNATGSKQAINGKLEGYGRLKFGMSFTEALAIAGSDRFNAYGLKECFDDLPLAGCFLTPATDAAPFIIQGGIPYELQLDFNKYDRLTDIALRYSREGRISRDECLALFGRTLDWATREFGPFYASLGETEGLKQRTSPAGISFGVYERDEPNFVINFVRTASLQPSPKTQAKPIAKWDNDRFVSLFSYFIVVEDDPHCEIAIDFKEPTSVERRRYEKPSETPATAEPEPEPAETSEYSAEEPYDETYAEEVRADGNNEVLDY